MRLATMSEAVDAGRQVASDWKKSGEAFCEAWQDRRAATERFVKNTQETMDDVLYQAKRRIKRNPLGSVAVAFSAGILAGALLARNGRD